jgi:hypothetical protein
MDHIGAKILPQRRFKLKPRFSIIHHPLRVKFSLSFTTYAVIDSIHQLSHRPDHPWCTQSKSEIAKFLDISDRQAFRAIKDGLDKALLEKNERGDLRSSAKWVENVVLYDHNERDNVA